MGLWSRALLIMRVKGRVALDKAENPVEVLGYADEQQQELLRRVKQGMIEVAISKRQLQQQVDMLDKKLPKVENQARRALSAGREDLARIAVERKQQVLTELSSLQEQVAEVGDEEQRLVAAEQQLSSRIEEFRMHRQVVSARYSAAEAQVRVNEALGGVSKDFSELGMALGRTEEKISRMLAHASAIDALTESGALSSPLMERDIVERQLNEVAQREAVDDELNTLKAEMEDAQSPETGRVR